MYLILANTKSSKQIFIFRRLFELRKNGNSYSFKGLYLCFYSCLPPYFALFNLNRAKGLQMRRSSLSESL
ncbi:hypothetical protein XELAEV_18025822mg [Xenopus laevis]|uniref:Uncharacterized protein n=1 Tax=Xenopus laevis TaxID=8355 RepID=A0A974HMG1_XENLA|nr:hypothetical protein XELAEV_18025822mg [Xenopus laevis]